MRAAQSSPADKTYDDTVEPGSEEARIIEEELEILAAVQKSLAERELGGAASSAATASIAPGDAI